MHKIDVSRQVNEMEEIPRSSDDPAARMEAVAVLSRWQYDQTLDEPSRQKARALIREEMQRVRRSLDLETR